MNISRILYIILLIIIIFFFIWIGITNTKYYDISKLNISKYDNLIVNDFDVTLTAAKKDFSIESNQFTITIINKSNSMLSYGYDYQLETFINGKWYIVPFSQKGLFPLVKMSLYENTEASFPIDLDIFECYPGKHRLIKEINIEDYGTTIVSYEFNLY